MKFNLSLLAALAVSSAVANTASAHITMVYPKPKTSQPGGQKMGPPCGGMDANAMPTTFRPGETITVKWNETISHIGHFRVAFNDKGMDFPAPMTRKDPKPANLPVFFDGLFEKTKGGPMGPHEQTITFPNTTCTNCYLQIIQIMQVDPPYQATQGGDVYYQCAQITLAGDPVGGGGADAGTTPGADGGTATGGTSGAGGGYGQGGSSGSAGAGASGNSGGATGTGGDNGATGGATGAGNTSGGGSGSPQGSGGAVGPSAGSSGNGTSSGGSTGSGTASGGSTGSGNTGATGGSGSKPSSDDSGTPSPKIGCSMGGRPGDIGALGLLSVVAGLVISARRRRRR